MALARRLVTVLALANVAVLAGAVVAAAVKDDGSTKPAANAPSGPPTSVAAAPSTPAASSGPASVTSPVPTSVPPPTIAPPTAAPGAPTTPAAASAVATRPAPRSIAVQTSAPAAHRPSPAKPAPSKSAVAPVGAKPGTYSEATTGTIKSALGTMSADGDTTLTVSADKGRDQEQKEVDKNSTTDEIARFAADGSVRFTYLHISSAAFDDTFTFTTPELVFPAKPAPGQTWSWSAKSDDGKTTITFKGTYKGTEDVTIGGTVVHCLIVQADFTLQSDTTITVTQTADYAPAYGLIVRQHQMASGTAYGTPFTADTTTTLKSLTPQ